MTLGQTVVYKMLDKYGPMPDHVLVPVAQHLGDVHMSSSGVRSRRSELAHMGVVKQVGSVDTESGRSAAIWAVKS